LKKWEIFRTSIFLPGLQISAQQPTNASARHLITSRLFSFLPNIIGRMTKNFGKNEAIFLNNPKTTNSPKKMKEIYRNPHERTLFWERTQQDKMFIKHFSGGVLIKKIFEYLS
jgi:hypothetical protein